MEYPSQIEEKVNIKIISDKEINKIINKLKTKHRIFPILGMFIGLLVYFASLLTVVFIFTGSTLFRTIFVLLLVYQFFFAKYSENYRNFLKFMRPWEIFTSYSVHCEKELENEKCLFSFHPHGVIGFGASMCGAMNEVLYKAYFCGSRAMINLPLSGIIARWMGVVGVDNKNFKDLMKQGKNIIFVPGGFEEATLTNYDKDRIFIKERKGFIKYALEYGYKVYPCYTFNENKIFYTFNYCEKFRLFLNKYKIPATLFYGNYGILPNCDIDLFTVIGKPINLPLICHPTKEEVDMYHQIYIDELVNVYNRYKLFFKASHELEIV
jgi:hypothetical protein